MNTRTNMLADSLTATHLAHLVEQAIKQIASDLRTDVLMALEQAITAETNARGRLVLQQLIDNAYIAAQQRVPLCQDTGSVWVLLEVGTQDETEHKIAIPSSIFSLIDQAVANAYRAAGLRMSLVRDALTDRSNSGDNTPAFCELYLNPHKIGVTLHVMLKGGGSDNASRIVMLAPGSGVDGVRQVVIEAVREKGANACPPLIIGVGVGSTFDKVGGLAKRALLRTIGDEHPDPQVAILERCLLAEINASGIGPGGFGGDTTALAIHILTAPCHITALPVAVNLGCNSLRSVSIDLGGAL